MGKPKAPKPADPKETGAAQTATNIGTAIAQQNLNNVNQVTPYGNLTYEQTGTYEYRDPLNGQVHDIPTYTATQTLNEEQQAILDQNNRASLNLATLGADQSGRLNELLGRPVNTAGLPEAGDAGAIRRTDLQRTGTGPTLRTSIGDPGKVRSSIADAGPLQRQIGSGGPIRGVGQGADLQNSIADAGDIRRDIGPVGEIERAGNGPQLVDQIADAGNITRTYGTDFSADRQRVEDALFARMNPQLEKDRERLESRLASQGIRMGSEAYKDAMGDFNRQTNDARFGAILSAGQEQSRLADLEARRAGFENAAQAQQFGQNAQSAGFTNTARQQGFQNDLSRVQVNNAAQGQEFGQQSERTAVANDAQRQQFDQNTAEADFRNTSLTQELDNRLAATGFNNDAQAQRFAQGTQRAEFANRTQQQQFDQNATEAGFENSSQAQRFQQEAARAGFSNDATQQMFQNRVQGITMGNQASVQETNADIARFNAANTSRDRALQERFAVRNQPLNEITALMSGSQVKDPTFITPDTAQMATTDFAGIQANYDQLMQRRYEQQMAQRNSLFGGVLGFGAALLSDKRAKTDIEEVGKTKDGQKIYSYRYKSGGPVQIGLMAQEVEKKRPDAVVEVDGMKMVDYGIALGRAAA
ncbi:MAG: tail fiber domain-containing protein [Roseibium sp.]|nr:tail fiber domain-containing protein [Roseibium sp.]